MYKIDFHCHTKPTKDGESEKRFIKPSDFIKKLNDSNVKYVAITNHNSFDLDQYNGFQNENYLKTEKEILIFPGIEIDVCNNHLEKDHKCKFKQMNVIINPLYVWEFNKIVNDYFTEINKVLSYKQINNMFKKYQPIYFLDYKNNRRFDENEYKKFKNIINNEDVPIIYDVSNIKSQFMLISQNEKVLVGSDNENWDDYEDESKKLSDLVFDFKSYEKLRWMFKYQYTDEFIKDAFRTLHEENFQIDINDNENFNIKIYNGLNLIFGGKGTGKSLIIEKIKTKLNPKEISTFSSTNKNKNFDSEFVYKNKNFITQELLDNIYGNNFIANVNESLNFVKDFNKNNENNENNEIVSFGKWYKDGLMVMKENWKLKNILNIDINPNIDKQIKAKIKEKNKSIKNIIDTYECIYKIWNKQLKFKDEPGLNIIKNQKNKLQDILYKCNNDFNNVIFHKFLKNYLISKFINEFLLNFKNNLDKMGTISQSRSIGLFKKCAINIAIYNQICILHDLISSNKYEALISKKRIEIPEKGEINFCKKINFWYEGISNSRYEKNINSNLKNQSNLKELLSFLSEIKNNPFKNYSNDTNILKKIEFLLLNDSINATDLIWLSWNFWQNDSFYSLSDGEKEYIMLLNKLDNDDAKYYLLDEPALYIGSKLISEKFIKRITDLKRKNKKIIIVSHNALVGLNTFPINMIYREYNNDLSKYETYYGNIMSDEFINELDETKKHNFMKLIIKHFEGGTEFFNQRKELYEINNKNNK